MERIVVNAGGDRSRVRFETLEGIEYVVAPASILEEGVWPGSGGDAYYPDAEIAKSVPAWNHKPLVVYHPTDDDGNHVSACSPAVLEKRKVGMILNTTKDDKLRTECWFNVTKTKQVDRRVYDRVESGKPIEMSTGLFTTNVPGKGTFVNKQGQERPYDFTVRDYRPDHLAVLPDRLGAYSNADGGGVLVNAANALGGVKSGGVQSAGRLPEGVLHVLSRGLSAAAQLSGAALVGNELSFGNTQSQVCELLCEKYGKPGKYWEGYVVDLYKDYVVFRNPTPEDYGATWMQPYSVSADTVSLTGDATPVKRVVEYVANGRTYAADSFDKLVPREREGPMADKTTFDKKAHVDSLIGNGWEEGDREELMKVSDAVLQKVVPVKPVAVVVTANEVKSASPTPKTTSLDELIANADPATRDSFNEMRRTADEVKTALVDKITANARNKFTKEWLREQPVAQLRGMAALCEDPAVVAGGGTPMFIGNAGGHIPTPTNMPKEGLGLPSTADAAN